MLNLKILPFALPSLAVGSSLNCSDDDPSEFASMQAEEEERIAQMINDENIPESQRVQYREMHEMASYRPPNFSQMHAMPFLPSLKEKQHRGFKFVLNWQPLPLAELSGTVVVDRRVRNYKIRANAMVPSRTNPQAGLQMMGINDSGEKKMMQFHYALNNKETLTLVSQYMRPDHRQSVFDLEYSRYFNRMGIAVKSNNMQGQSLSLITAVGKKSYAGFEVNLAVFP